MYEKDGCVLSGSSASALDNNLSVIRVKDDEYKAAVVHKSTVNLISWNVSDGHQHRIQIQCKFLNSANRAFVTQARWIRFRNVILLVVITTEAIQIYNTEGEEICSWLHNQYCDGSFLRGLTLLHDALIAIGTHTGSLLVLSLEANTLTLDAEVRTEHRGAVAALSSDDQSLVSGGDDGRICVWKTQAPYLCTQSFESYGYPCSSIVVSNGRVFAAYGSGHLRLFDIKAGLILAEITAHARWVTGLDLAESTGMVLSTSEDSFVRVWQLQPSQDQFSVILKFSECISDVRLCGGRFLDAGRHKICSHRIRTR